MAFRKYTIIINFSKFYQILPIFKDNILNIFKCTLHKNTRDFWEGMGLDSVKSYQISPRGSRWSELLRNITRLTDGPRVGRGLTTRSRASSVSA